MTTRTKLLLGALLLGGCATPATPRGSAAPVGPVLFHEVTFEVAAPREPFVRAFLAAPLERFIKGTAALPGVDHTEALTDPPYPAEGSVRRVVLKDGGTAREEVLTQDGTQLRYLVTDYTARAARPVAWGLGEFTFAPAGPAGGTTRVTWRYTFGLRGDRFPGSLGALGRGLFRARFLERDYAAFMNAQVREIQAFAQGLGS